jgi:hypothetical protein
MGQDHPPGAGPPPAQVIGDRSHLFERQVGVGLVLEGSDLRPAFGVVADGPEENDCRPAPGQYDPSRKMVDGEGLAAKG